jgi:short-subunit dehydrogenase
MPDEFSKRYGPWALVTGAAEGLGAEFAAQVAGHGLNTLLVDVQIEKAKAHAEGLAKQHGVETRAVECDLSKTDFLEGLRVQTEGLEIGFLVCCAGIGTNGPFLETPIDSLKRIIQINAMATLELSYEYARPMAERGKGGIIIIASNSAYAGSPYVAAYAATKAFDLSLGEALWYELSEHGIDAMAFSPQGTNTPGLRRGMTDLKEGEEREGVMMPKDAVAMALSAIGKKASMRADMPEDDNRTRLAAINRAGNVMKAQAKYTAE